MYRYIGIEDLVANALIEMMRSEEANRRISVKTLADYGTVIVRLLTASGQNAILFLTKESTYEFVHYYAEYFSIIEHENIEYIELKDGVQAEELRRQFRKNLTVDLAKALTGEESLRALGISSRA